MGRRFYLLKTEPDEYSFDDLVRQGVGRWDGVRNYSARNHLRAMKVGDWVLIHHTGKAREIVGIAEVVREHYPDPTANGADFSAVDVRAVCPLGSPVSLAQVKADAALSTMILARQPRLSVQPVTLDEFQRVLVLGETKIPSI